MAGFSGDSSRPLNPHAEYELDNGKDSSFCDNIEFVDKGEGSFYPDEGGFKPVRIRKGDYGEFARDPFLGDEGHEGNFLHEDGTTIGAPVATIERDIMNDKCLNLDPSMGKKKFKQMTKNCKKLDVLRRKAARTEVKRARADINRAKAHDKSGKGEERRAKGASKKIDSVANKESAAAMASTLQDPGTGGGNEPAKTIIPGIPDMATYIGGAVLTVGLLWGVATVVKKSMAPKAASAPAATPAV